MPVIRYSIGVLISLILIYTGMKLYVSSEEMDKLGVKISLLGAVMILAVLWPVSVPALTAYAVKHVIDEVYKSVKEKIE